jgi:hypothetical protein
MKTNLTLLLVLLICIAILLMIGQCKGGNGTEVKGDTLRDTAVIILPGEVSEIHVPTLVKETVYKTDTLIEFVPGSVEYESGDTFYAIRRDYTDTIRFKEGRVIVNNSVFRNYLIQQQVFLDSVKQTTITNTVNIKDKPKGALYLGAGGGWSPKDTMMNIGASFLWKTKGGKMFEVGASVDTRGRMTYGGKVYFPLTK